MLIDFKSLPPKSRWQRCLQFLKSGLDRFRQQRQTRMLLVLFACVVVLALLVIGAMLWHDRSHEADRVAELRAAQPPVPDVRREIKTGTVQSGETVTGLFNQYFSSQDVPQLVEKAGKVFPLTSLCAGQPYKVCQVDGATERFEYDIDREAQLVIERGGAGYEVRRVPIDYTVKTEVVAGTITSSLFEAVTGLGETDQLAMNLADIFAWDVDFIRDIRSGDSFRVLVEKRFRDNKPAGYGTILAAEFVNQGETFQAVRYSDGSRATGYYDLKGNSMRKAFLKAPLPFSRISSGFTMKRFHPIAKTWRAHPAIDYAAPAGTPIKTVGDGTLSAAGFTSGNGNYIKVRHAGGYETIYLHMRAFAKGMRAGRRVEQGQVIGYVGSTGLATGPHLCFRMTKNGAPVNPAKVKSAAAEPIPKAKLAAFQAYAAPLLDRLAGRTPPAAAPASAPAPGQPQ